MKHLVAMCLLAVCADARANSILTGTVDLRITRLEVVWVDSPSDMRELLAANNIRVNGDSERGFALRGRHAETGEDVCVIYALRPKEMNDAATLVLGHELLHCLLGKYHQ